MYTFLKTLDRKQIRLKSLLLTAKTVTALLIFGFLSHMATAQNIDWTKVSEQYNMPEGVELNQGTRSSPPSLITLGGDGSKTVEFRADLPSEGRYRLDGWWVASFNMSKKTAYIVEHRLGIDTVYANQSTNSAQWVELGEYEFTGTSSDRVTISNLGGDSFNYVVADAVRWVGLDEEITSSESEFESIADSYQLINSYPNPFNPSTEIIYQLEHSGWVHLEVYNLQGQRLSTLVEEWQSAGEHSVQWDARGLSSGLYFVRLAFENSQSYWYASHKVTLVK